jgi:hypothetical protein
MIEETVQVGTGGGSAGFVVVVELVMPRVVLLVLTALGGVVI